MMQVGGDVAPLQTEKTGDMTGEVGREDVPAADRGLYTRQLVSLAF